MKIMSLNCWGLAGPQKRSALRRVVDLDCTDILPLQETMRVGVGIKVRLESWLGGWIFETLDVKGHSGGLEIGWNARIVSTLNVWGMDSVLGMSFRALEMVGTFDVVNIYGPYLNRIPFWEKIFNYSLLREEYLIIGGDLNFSLGQAKVWGPHACADVLTDFFTQKLVEKTGWI